MRDDALGPQALNLGSAGMYYMVWRMPTISLSAVLNPEESAGYVALCPELDIASQGESIEQAMHNLKETVEGFFEVASLAEVETRLKRPALFTHFEVSRALSWALSLETKSARFSSHTGFAASCDSVLYMINISCENDDYRAWTGLHSRSTAARHAPCARPNRGLGESVGNGVSSYRRT
jgi:predicted RNase H-like HicB family nuclease